MSRPALSRQISALNAEIAVRKKEHTREIAAGRLKEAHAAYVIESLEAAADTLRWLDAIQPKLKQRLFNNDQSPVGGCW